MTTCASPTGAGGTRVMYYDIVLDVHPSARKHGIADDDIEHATTHAMTIEDHDETPG